MVKTAGSMAPRRAPKPDIGDIVVQRFSQRADEFGDKSSTAAIKWGPAKGLPHGFFQEYGTVHHGAHPFMRPAFEQHRDKVLTIISATLWRELAGRGISRQTQSADPGGEIS